HHSDFTPPLHPPPGGMVTPGQIPPNGKNGTFAHFGTRPKTHKTPPPPTPPPRGMVTLGQIPTNYPPPTPPPGGMVTHGQIPSNGIRVTITQIWVTITQILPPPYTPPREGW